MIDINTFLSAQESAYALLKSYHINFELKKIEVNVKQLKINYIYELSCDEGYEDICKQIIENLLNKKKKNEKVEIHE